MDGLIPNHMKDLLPDTYKVPPKNKHLFTHEEEVFLCHNYREQLMNLKSNLTSKNLLKIRHQLISYYGMMAKEKHFKQHPVLIIYHYLAELTFSYMAIVTENNK